VPGEASETRTPVDFPTPPSVQAWSIGGGLYDVEFQWDPEAEPENPALVGSFNAWNRTSHPMTDPDQDGIYTATATLSAGEHLYKFAAGEDGWYSDPQNPAGTPDGHGGENSVLRLGVFAMLGGLEVAKGDGRIEMRGFEHHQDDFTFYDVASEGDALIRFRILRDDIQRAEIVFVDQQGQETGQAEMILTGTDELFDYWEYHLFSEQGQSAPAGYHFKLLDGGASATTEKAFPVRWEGIPQAETPDWARDAIWYQIMVDRFRDGDPMNNPEYTAGTGRSEETRPWTLDFFTVPGEGKLSAEELFTYDGDGNNFPDIWSRLYGGDFQGVIDRLDYLDSLGINALYLNPVFEATSAHKYNGKSFVHADDGYGVAGEFAESAEKENLLDASTWEFNESDQKFLDLVEEAHKRDMRIIIDGVFNHLGDDAVPFLDVKENGKDSPFADWYIIESWEPFEYEGWAGFDGLPEFRKNEEHGLASESLRQHIYDVTSRWMDPNGDGDPSDGVDGWRLDVPFEIPKVFWENWRDHVKSINPDAYIVGEVWQVEPQWVDGETFDALMNYPFSRRAFNFFADKEEKISATEFDRRLGWLRTQYPRATTYVQQNLYDSHDTDRWSSRIKNPDRPYDGENRIQDPGGEDYDYTRPKPAHFERLALMALFQTTYVGAPMIWYGTEVGMYGADDPMCRLPMWWPGLMPYENPGYRIDSGLRETFRELFHLRAEHPELRRGNYRTVLADDEKDSFGYLRSLPGENSALLVVMNNSSEKQILTIEAPADILPEGFAEVDLLYGPAASRSIWPSHTMTITLPGVSGTVYHVASSSQEQQD